MGGKIIGPHFIDGNLNDAMYAVFLRNVLPMLLQDVSLHDRMAMYFQHDGCPAHSSRAVEAVLNSIFHDRWIGPHGHRI